MAGRSDEQAAHIAKTETREQDAGYVQRMRRRARELHDADAFEPPASQVEEHVSLEQVKGSLAANRKTSRRRSLIFGLVCIVFVLVSLPLPYDPDYFGDHQLYMPDAVLGAYAAFFQVNVLPLFDPTAANLAASTLNAFGDAYGANAYGDIIGRAALTFLTLICAWMLAASGLLFQTSFRNPLAAPSMLGVADGASLGYVLFVMFGYTTMGNNPPLFHLCVYGCGIAVVIFVLFSSRFVAGSKTYSVIDMLLIGTVVAQMVGGVVTFVTNYGMDYETWLAYYDLLQALDMANEPLTYAVAAAVAVVASIPVVALRFRLNTVAFPNEEGRMLGVRAGALRWVAIACGSLMQLAAIASIGQVAMVSLAVPFLVRYLYPSDFRSQLVGNLLVGIPVLLACQVLSHFIVVNMQPMPIGTVVGAVIMPFFVWMMALQRRGWE